MTLLSISSLLLTVSALFAWLNARTLKLPTTIGIMVISLGFSLLLVLFGQAGFVSGVRFAENVLESIDFNRTLLHGMLGFLLFAGAMHVDLSALLRSKWIIGLLASFGVVFNTAVIGGGTWLLLDLLGQPLPFTYCLLFGSLISPTDPVAVMSILKSAGVSAELETKIVGESLFNDGVAIVVFLALYGIAVQGDSFDAPAIGMLFLKETLGGAIFGYLTGRITLWMLERVDDYKVEILLTLALVAGGSTAATSLHISAPIAIVVAGLLIGNHGRSNAMSGQTVQHLDNFWELIDEILNAVLFLLIGLELLVLDYSVVAWIAGVLIALLVIGSRYVAVSLPVALLRLTREFHPNIVGILTWGGLRGGISVALALSIPAGEARDTILAITYVIVVLSILVQGLTIGRLVRATASGSEHSD